MALEVDKNILLGLNKEVANYNNYHTEIVNSGLVMQTLSFLKELEEMMQSWWAPLLLHQYSLKQDISILPCIELTVFPQLFAKCIRIRKLPFHF